MQTASETLALDDVKLAAKRIFSLIASELGQVEVEFERQAQSNVQVIAFLGDYLRASGGMPWVAKDLVIILFAWLQ